MQLAGPEWDPRRRLVDESLAFGIVDDRYDSSVPWPAHRALD